MTVLEAAEQVLESTQEALSCHEIASLIEGKELLGQPSASPSNLTRAVRDAISQDIEQHGSLSRFIKLPHGEVALRRVLDVPGNASPTRKAPIPYPFPLLAAAKEILGDRASDKPMHYITVLEEAVRKGLLPTSVMYLSPRSTLYAEVKDEIRRAEQRGELSTFIVYGQGQIGLRAQLPQHLYSMVTKYNQQVRAEYLQRLLNVDPIVFENLVGSLLTRMGFKDVQVTQRGNDGGIDILCQLQVGDMFIADVAVQVKRWKDNVQRPQVHGLRGSLSAGQRGMIVTTSDFSPGALDDARQVDRVPILLMNGFQLVEELINYGIGVSRHPYQLVALDTMATET